MISEVRRKEEKKKAWCQVDVLLSNYRCVNNDQNVKKKV